MRRRASQSTKLWRSVLFFAATFVLALHVACGGGGGSAPSPPPPPPPPPPAADFSLSASPASFSLVAGGSASVSILASSTTGFTGTITVTISGLPAGVLANPASFTLQAGGSQQVTLTAAQGVVATSGTITFTGTSGTVSHAAQTSLTLYATVSATPPLKTRYVRTDAATQYFLWRNDHWIVYHAPTARFFVTDPESNFVFALDSVTQTVVGRISLPGAFGIDYSADNSTLWVGTLSGDVYTVDPYAMSVTQRYVASQIGPYGFASFAALPMADGRVALLGAQYGIASVDGSPGFALWNPADNSTAIYASGYGQGFFYNVPVTRVCGPLGNIGGFQRTPDRTKLLIGSIFSDATLCLFDSATGIDTWTTTSGFSSTKIHVSPDGQYIILPSFPDQAVVFDANLNFIREFPIAGGTPSSLGWTITPDSRTLIAPDENTIYAYDIASGQLMGWMSNIYVTTVSGGFVVGPAASPYLQAHNGMGLFAGPMEEGVGFIDMTQLRPPPVGTKYTNLYVTPATGPASGGTQVQWSTFSTTTAQSTIYFGAQKATGLSKSQFQITAITPPGPPGPVDLYEFADDASVHIVPEAFSYGPTIQQVTPNYSLAEGGGYGAVYGYGFGPADLSSGIPQGLSVMVGAQNAAITAYDRNAYGILSPPFLMQGVVFSVPPGVPGSSVPLTVTTPSGSATLPNAITCLPYALHFPWSGARFAQGVYDPHRDVYYFTDANVIRIFSRAQLTWLPSINLPNSPQRLWAIALSPDGSKLAVSDALTNTIYIVDPANPAAVSSYSNLVTNWQGSITNPAGLAIADSGIVYFTVYVEGGTGFHHFYKFNPATGVVSNFSLQGADGLSGAYYRVTITADNSRVFFNNAGHVFSVDTANDWIYNATTGPGCCYGDFELTLSANQTDFSASSFLYDSDLNGRSRLVLNMKERRIVSYVYGAKLSPDGALLFQPGLDVIDVFDGRAGNLLARVSLPFTLAPTYDALVANGKDNVMVAITGPLGDGIAFIDLTSIPEPAPLTYTAPRALPSASGQSAARLGARPPVAVFRPLAHQTVPRLTTSPRP